MKEIAYQAGELAFHTREANSFSYRYLFDTTDYDNLQLYFGVKNKYDCHLTNRDEFLSHLGCFLTRSFDFAVYPESSNEFASFLAGCLAPIAVCVPKTPLDKIRDEVLTMKWQKSELKSQLTRLDEMGGVFRINLVKSNQRERYIPLMFQSVDLPAGRGVIVDDSIFTAATIKALVAATGLNEIITVFTK
jgi:hypothetical protein